MSRTDARRPGGGSLSAAVSVAVHVVLLGLIWWIGTSVETVPPTRVYAVDLVSPPPSVEGAPSLEPPAPDPEPVQAPSEPAPDRAPDPEPDPAPPPAEQERPSEPTRDPEPRPDPPREEPPPERPDPSAGQDPDPESPGGDAMRVRTEGVECPSPAYCANMTRVITHMWRRTRPATARRERAEVFFYIERDGSVSGLRLLTRSGNRSFDLSAMEAVEIAGREGLFGPLPPDFGRDRLPVIAPFSPEM